MGRLSRRITRYPILAIRTPPSEGPSVADMFQQTYNASSLGLRNRFTDQRCSNSHHNGAIYSSNERRSDSK